jgi:succinate dehydrogenase / fumarate reductase cytochrome b subunit
MKNEPTPSRFMLWFDPRGRSASSWAFILNRITALGLTLYLMLHLIMLGQLAQGPDAYDGFIKLVHNPIFAFGELLVVAAGIMHGLNGIRIASTGLGFGGLQHKKMLVVAALLSAGLIILFGVRMFSFE